MLPEGYTCMVIADSSAATVMQAVPLHAYLSQRSLMLLIMFGLSQGGRPVSWCSCMLTFCTVLCRIFATS